MRIPDGHGRVELSTFHAPVATGVYTLVLATTGRRSGIPRRTCLIYGTAGEGFVVVASKGAADEDPAWFKNLRAEPSVGVQVGGRRFTARARVAAPSERELLWPQMARIFPLYDEYGQQTHREIPQSCSASARNSGGAGRPWARNRTARAGATLAAMLTERERTESHGRRTYSTYSTYSTFMERHARPDGISPSAHETPPTEAGRRATA